MNTKTNSNPILWRLRPAERRLILLVFDFIIALVALSISLYFWAQKDAWLDFSLEFLTNRIPMWFYLLPFIWILLLIEIYDLKRASRRGDTVRGVAIAAAISLVFYLLIYFTSTPNSMPRWGVSAFIVLSSSLTILWRLFYIRVFTAPQFMRRVLIVGAGRAGSTLANIVKDTWPPPFFLAGLIDDDQDKHGAVIDGFQVLGDSSQLMTIIEQEHITDLVFAISGNMIPGTFQTILAAEEKGIEVTTMPTMYEELLGRVPIQLLQSDWILRSFVDQVHASELFELAKRLLDILGSLVGMGILIFILPFVALGILIDDGGPIFYIQDRLGKNGRVYKIIKFRTMRNDKEDDTQPHPTVENDSRITRIGSFLRKSHLDEFPQFINILNGDMSLVGPRAERLELVNELQAGVPFYRARLLVKPGLTGWAQINYGYASTVNETIIKLEYDLYYIKHRSILLDIVILIRTVGTVLGFRGT
jgi:exopolysaccharide biosynthesis polyprenyl glycosylphosphotransferase